ncbi:diheme cytochrome c [Sulfurimonas sp. HSL-3221]|uniref:diheme cytochrome c n=1 Tax=Sulfurimonadaceae TaxID=2771471 RepID=UPI001E5021B4|nr:diheme cytochrome c [Sulfurimonas sp. HSL-3221]UFS61865.1 diheme cytochrome c [Sulfurimonas sp. HSL-3221]
MKKHLFVITCALLAAGSVYLAADDHHEKHSEQRHEKAVAQDAVTTDGQKRSAAGVETTAARLYKNECGACHMAYQPGLLPRASWTRMMVSLGDHFGTDATLEPADAAELATYLDANAYGSAPSSKHMARIAKSVSADAPMQISRSVYFVKEHRRIPQRFIDQADVKSLANCNACHAKAENGSYREREIFIPNYGRWDD